MDAESSLRNVVLNKNGTIDNVQKSIIVLIYHCHELIDLTA
jgi:hypothetical protein